MSNYTIENMRRIFMNMSAQRPWRLKEDQIKTICEKAISDFSHLEGDERAYKTAFFMMQQARDAN